MTNPPTPDELMEFYQQQGVASVEEAEMWNKLLGIHIPMIHNREYVKAEMTTEVGLLELYITFAEGRIYVGGFNQGYRISVS